MRVVGLNYKFMSHLLAWGETESPGREAGTSGRSPVTLGACVLSVMPGLMLKAHTSGL